MNYRQWAELNVGMLLKRLLYMEQIECANKHLIPLDELINVF